MLSGCGTDEGRNMGEELNSNALRWEKTDGEAEVLDSKGGRGKARFSIFTTRMRQRMPGVVFRACLAWL